MPLAPMSEILKMAQMVEYQTGAVVSRQIIKAKSGNVTMFAFDKNQELSEHTTPYDALVQVLDGQAEIIITGKSYLLKAGEGILMPAGQPHAVKALTELKMLLTMIKA